jgi:hypothetical protein
MDAVAIMVRRLLVEVRAVSATSPVAVRNVVVDCLEGVGCSTTVGTWGGKVPGDTGTGAGVAMVRSKAEIEDPRRGFA